MSGIEMHRSLLITSLLKGHHYGSQYWNKKLAIHDEWTGDAILCPLSM